MALFLLKPIIWNTSAYKHPAGVRVSKESYPGTHGYGHEEWNNADCMRLVEHGATYRVFHTEGLKHAPTEENTGQTFVFMTASHGGLQMLVGVAGNATYLGGEEDRSERARLARKLRLDELWHDAWNLPRVQALNGRDVTRFQKTWKSGPGWVPNWISPDETFWWPVVPIVLDPVFITGKTVLPKMFGAHKIIDLAVAERIMQSVPLARRTHVWHRLVKAMRIAPADPVGLVRQSRTTSTQTLALTNARLGQGKYRSDLEVIWGAACAVTDIAQPEALRASHILAWKDSTDHQRLDPNNGLLLCGTLDALFDRGFISFADDGSMLVSDLISKEDMVRIGIPKPLKLGLNIDQKRYLKIHRTEKFKGLAASRAQPGLK